MKQAPSDSSGTEQFKRFEELTRKLVSVPKKDVEKEEKKFKKEQEKKRRV
jgi:hypothetical protein